MAKGLSKSERKELAKKLADAFVQTNKDFANQYAATNPSGIGSDYASGLKAAQDKTRQDILDKTRQDILYPARPAAAPEGDSTASSTPPPQTPEQQTSAYNQEILGALSGIPGLLGEDIGAGIGYRGGIRDYFAKTLPNLDPEGLSEADYAELDAQNLADKKSIKSYLKDLLQNTTGQLRSSGFASSNLAGEGLRRGVYKPLSDAVLNLESQQAARRQNILNAKTGRRTQNFGTMLTSANVLGQGGLTPLTSGFVNPNQYGGWTAPDAFNAAFNLSQGDVGLRSGYDNQVLGAGLRPTTSAV